MITRPPAKNSAVIVRLDRTIRYAAACVFTSGVGDYWMPAFAGMTMTN
jgi:hypothetical protein